MGICKYNYIEKSVITITNIVVVFYILVRYNWIKEAKIMHPMILRVQEK